MPSRRLTYAPVAGADKLFTSDFNDFLLTLHDAFDGRARQLRDARAALLKSALDGTPVTHRPPSDATMKDWKVPPVPKDLQQPGIEISGPCSIPNMFINALNPGPEGERAAGDLDDDEDSGGHRLIDTVNAALNRLGAVNRELAFDDTTRNRKYRLQDGELPFFMHRERGLHLDEPDVQVDGIPVNAALLGTALTLFYAGRAQAQRGQGIYFYLPKLERPEEARWYRDVFALAQSRLPGLRDATIRGIVLVESLPCVWYMEEMLHALGEYSAGLNAARWDLKASIFEYVMADPKQVWPDRFGVDIKTTPFIGDIFRRLVAICLKHGAVPIGGMATALPSNDDEVNRVAGEAIKADKKWEAEQGFLRGWVAHIFHMKVAGDPFKELIGSGWKPSPAQMDVARYPVRIDVPKGPITLEGTRRNVRMLIEYVEGWLNGRGAKGIDSLAGKPGIHPALMEDLATGRMSTAQIAQRVLHRVRSDDGVVHDFALVRQLLEEETADIIRLGSLSGEAAARYPKASKIAAHWIRNYTAFDFRSLGSYTRADLDRIAAGPEAF